MSENEPKASLSENCGPVYGIELITSLPIGTDGMRQTMPSRSNLEYVWHHTNSQHVVAGYEVLLSHWREQKAEIKRLQAIIDAKGDKK